MYAPEEVHKMNEIVISNPLLFHSITIKERLSLITAITMPENMSEWDVKNLESVRRKIDRFLTTSSLSQSDIFCHLEKIETLRSKRAISRYSQKHDLFIAYMVKEYFETFQRFPENLIRNSVFLKRKIRFPDLTSIPFFIIRTTFIKKKTGQVLFILT